MDGISRIARERKRQIEEEHWTHRHDEGHTNGALAVNAAALAVNGTDAHIAHPDLDEGEDYDEFGLVKKHAENRIRQLEIAGALLAAEIDRLLWERGTKED